MTEYERRAFAFEDGYKAGLHACHDAIDDLRTELARARAQIDQLTTERDIAIAAYEQAQQTAAAWEQRARGQNDG